LSRLWLAALRGGFGLLAQGHSLTPVSHESRLDECRLGSG